MFHDILFLLLLLLLGKGCCFDCLSPSAFFNQFLGFFSRFYCRPRRSIYSIQRFNTECFVVDVVLLFFTRLSLCGAVMCNTVLPSIALSRSRCGAPDAFCLLHTQSTRTIRHSKRFRILYRFRTNGHVQNNSSTAICMWMFVFFVAFIYGNQSTVNRNKTKKKKNNVKKTNTNEMHERNKKLIIIYDIENDL